MLFCFLPALLFAGNPKSFSGADSDHESTKVSLYVPGFLIKAGAWFVPEKEDNGLKTALKKLRSTSIVVREGRAYEKYNATHKYERKISKMHRQHLEEVVAVNTEEENVSIGLKQNKKDKIRQVVVLVDDGSSSFVFVRLRCNVDLNELKALLQKEGISGHKLGEIMNI